MGDELEQWPEELVDVEEHHRSRHQPQLVPRQQLERLIEGAEAAREHDDAVGQLGHAGLASMHGRLDIQFGEALVSHLAFDELLGHDADGFAAATHHCIGHHPHQPDVTSAEDQPMAALRDRLTQGRCGAEVGRIVAGARSAEHADVLRRRLHDPSLAWPPWGVAVGPARASRPVLPGGFCSSRIGEERHLKAARSTDQGGPTDRA